jgi:neutral trehalase
MGCFNQTDVSKITDKVLAYIERTGIDDYPGGVPNTLNPSGEQWDFPNVWPPMQVGFINNVCSITNSSCTNATILKMNSMLSYTQNTTSRCITLQMFTKRKVCSI